jgi:hypothetical protein
MVPPNEACGCAGKESGGPRTVAPARRGFETVVIKKITPAGLQGEVRSSWQCEGFVWELQAGYCVATGSFNYRETIRRLAMQEMVHNFFIGGKPAFRSFQELNAANPGCCQLNPGGGDSEFLSPNLAEYLGGWNYGMSVVLRTSDFEEMLERGTLGHPVLILSIPMGKWE